MGGLIQTTYAKVPKYVMSMISSAGRMDPDQHYYNRWHSSNAVNKYNNPKYDRVVEAAKIEMDVDKRRALYDEAQKILMEEIPSIVMFNPAFFDAAQKYVKGYKPLTIGFLRLWDVWLDK
jgi:ABC-type transport system substrate-binding protein